MTPEEVENWLRTNVWHQVAADKIRDCRQRAKAAEALAAKWQVKAEGERELCASVVEHLSGWGPHPELAEHIAAVIRAMPPPTLSAADRAALSEQQR